MPRNARGKQQQQQQAQDYSHTKYSNENPNIEVYVKPKFDEASGSVSAPSRRTGAGGGLGEGGNAGGAEAPEGAAASAAAGGKVGGRTGGGVGGGAGGSAGGGKSAGGRKRRGGVAVGLADLEQGRVFKQGAPCECQAAIHHLVNNCLACGKIVCEQEGEGPCKFCGVLVLRGSDSMGDAAPGVGMEGEWEEWEEVGGAAAGTTEAEAKALAFRDRLVEYNRTSAQRTVVIDDQSDYFKSNGADGDGDAWLTNEEREILRRREEEREREEEERRRRVVVTLDLIGRRVLVADSPGADVAGGGAVVAGSEGAKPGQKGSEKQTKAASGGASGRRGGGRTGVGSIFLMGGQGDKEQGERDQIPTMKQEVVSGIKVLIKGEGGGGGGSAAGGSGRNLPIAAPVFVKPSSANSSTNGASGTGGAAVAGGAAAGGASSNEATGQGKKGGKGKKGQQEQQHVKEQESDRRRGAYKEGMARLQHDSPLMEAMREIEEEVGGRSGGGGNRRTRDRCVECFIRRSRKTGTFTLFLGVPPNSTENGKFLLAARKCGWRPSSPRFLSARRRWRTAEAAAAAARCIPAEPLFPPTVTTTVTTVAIGVVTTIVVTTVAAAARAAEGPAPLSRVTVTWAALTVPAVAAPAVAGVATGQDYSAQVLPAVVAAAAPLVVGAIVTAQMTLTRPRQQRYPASAAPSPEAARTAAGEAQVGEAAGGLAGEAAGGAGEAGGVAGRTPPPATPSPATAAVLAAGAAAAAATSPLLSSLFHSNRYSHTRYSNHSCDLPEEQKSDEQAPGQSQPPTCTSSFTPSPLPRPSWPSSPASSPAAAHPAGATSAPPHFPAPSALHSPASPPDVLIAPTGSSASPSPSASASAAPPCPASAFPPCLELPSSALSSASPAARSCAYRLKSGEEMGAGESMGSSGKEESDEQQSMREEGVEEGGQWEKKSQEESSPEDGSLEEGNQQEECGDWPTDGACEQQESSGEGRSEQEGNQAATPPFAASSAPSLAALPAAPSASAAPSPAAAPPAFNAEADAEGDTEGDLASVKNFQLIEGGGPGNDSDKPVLLQFGKIGKDTFTMDYRYPLTAFQIGKDTFTMDYRYPLTAFQITTGAGGGLGEGGSAGGAEAPEGAAASAAAGGKVGGRTGGGVGGGAGGSAGGGKSAGGRKRRGGVAVGLADLEQGRVFKQGAPRIDKERGSRGGEVGNQGVGYRGVIGGGTAGGGLDSRENRDRDGPCGIPADLAGLADLADDEADVDGRFDICVQTDQRGGLLRGVGGAGGVRGSEAGIDGGRGGVLQDGMLEIVKECRRLGLGPGGFYRPKFLNGGQMKLHMMCLGQQHWEPNLRTYQPRRTYVDDAKPPALPLSISSLAVQAVSAAQTAVRAASGSSNKSILPDMTPSVCIANFYSPRRGALGMHQDKDEPPASIRRGAPVVSFSVGDSADFLFGWQRDPEKAAKVVLESGDVVVFGGPSRLMFHGVPCVHGGTAPDWLAQETGLRPGRLNLTVREL
ncbi:unnamed protein product [Closterium sp. Naga37s-1]|nr:unnamed protein product [Closterium sp. Naga37s-1]